MIYISFISIAVISYLLGSLNFGVILSRKLEKDDVRNHGSGNAGSTNMLRNYGAKAGVLTILGDMIKVFVAIFISIKIYEYTPALLESNHITDVTLFVKAFSGFFCVIGHIFPCFFKFKGGKGVATSGGMVFAIDWRIALILLAIFFVVVLATKYVSLGSIIMAILYPVFMYLFYQAVDLTIISVIFTVIVLITHRLNIKKILTKTENKVNLSKLKKSKSSEK